MDIKKYTEESSRTFAYAKKPLDEKTLNLLHCAIGIGTESGELLDAFKKHIFYGKPLDHFNTYEEVGDMMWYIANFCRLMGINLEEILQININKLKVRYPEKFTEELAEHRDLDKERSVLEGKKNDLLKENFCIKHENNDLFQNEVIDYLKKEYNYDFNGLSDWYIGIFINDKEERILDSWSSVNFFKNNNELIKEITLEEFIKLKKQINNMKKEEVQISLTEIKRILDLRLLSEDEFNNIIEKNNGFLISRSPVISLASSEIIYYVTVKKDGKLQDEFIYLEEIKVTKI